MKSLANFWSGKPWSKNHLAENLKYFVQTMEGSSHQHYGTETKVYRFCDPERARVFHSRDVQFNEHQQETDMVKEQEPVHNTQMELDFPEFEEAIVNEEPVVNELPKLVANEA